MGADAYHDVARAEMAAFDALPYGAREAVRSAVHPLPTGELAEALRKHRMVYHCEADGGEAWLVAGIRGWDAKLGALHEGLREQAGRAEGRRGDSPGEGRTCDGGDGDEVVEAQERATAAGPDWGDLRARRGAQAAGGAARGRGRTRLAGEGGVP